MENIRKHAISCAILKHPFIFYSLPCEGMKSYSCSLPSAPANKFMNKKEKTVRKTKNSLRNIMTAEREGAEKQQQGGEGRILPLNLMLNAIRRLNPKSVLSNENENAVIFRGSCIDFLVNFSAFCTAMVSEYSSPLLSLRLQKFIFEFRD